MRAVYHVCKKFSRGNQFILKLSDFYNVSSANYYGNNESWQHLWSSESLLFSEYMHPLWGIATLRVAPGMSAQFYRLHGKDLISYVAPRAQIVLIVQLAQKQYVQFLALYDNSFPQLSMMSTATQQVNIWHIKRGNPDLKQTVYKYTLDSPEYSYSGTTFTPADRASAYVKLSWSFDFGKKTSRDNLSIDRTISTGVIRAE